jgi:hypothetical protein
MAGQYGGGVGNTVSNLPLKQCAYVRIICFTRTSEGNKFCVLKHSTKTYFNVYLSQRSLGREKLANKKFWEGFDSCTTIHRELGMLCCRLYCDRNGTETLERLLASYKQLLIYKNH